MSGSPAQRTPGRKDRGHLAAEAWASGRMICGQLAAVVTVAGQAAWPAAHQPSREWRMVTDMRAPARAVLGDGVLPLVLAGAAHHEQVATARGEGAGGRAGRAGAEQEAAPLPQRHRHDQRVGQRLAVGVAVPGDPVPPVAVEVDVHRVEVDPVALGHRHPHLLQRRRQVGERRPPTSPRPSAAPARCGRTSGAPAAARVPRRAAGRRPCRAPAASRAPRPARTARPAGAG